LNLLEQLAAEFPAEPEYRQKLYWSYLGLGGILRRTGRVTDAAQPHRRCLELVREAEAGGTATGSPADRHWLGLAQINLANILRNQGRRGEAEQYYRRGLALLEELERQAANGLDAAPYRKDLVFGLQHFGTFLGADRPAEAESIFRRELALSEKLVADCPAVPEYRAWLAYGLGYLAVLQGQSGRSAEAEENYRRSLALNQKVAGEFPAVLEYREAVADTYHCLGELLRDTGRPGEAEACFRRGLDVWERVAADCPAEIDRRKDVLKALASLQALLQASGRAGQAEDLDRRRLAVARTLVADFPAAPEGRAILADALMQLRPGVASEDEVRTAVRELGRFVDTPRDQNNVAWFLVTCRDRRFRDPGRAVELSRRTVDAEPKNGAFRNTLGVARYRAGDVLGAVAALEQSMRLRDGGDAEDWFFLAMAHRRLGDPYRPLLYYLAAVRWMDNKKQQHNDELRRFRAEAADLLGVRDGPRQ
jgi:tetratricopeptide (TPR) repeat protein